MLSLEQILKLPSIVIKEYTIGLLPASRVMFFVTKYEKVLYIGSADNLKTKWKSHPKLDWALHLECDLHWLEVDSRLDLNLATTDHLLFYAPPWNSLNKNCLTIRERTGLGPILKSELKVDKINNHKGEEPDDEPPPKRSSSVRDRLRNLGR